MQAYKFQLRPKAKQANLMLGFAGCVDKQNRQTQAKFKCIACGFEINADHNAALNILAAGLAVTACGAGKAQAPAMNQEPAYSLA